MAERPVNGQARSAERTIPLSRKPLAGRTDLESLGESSNWFLYGGELVGDRALHRRLGRDERLRSITRVTTPNHEVRQETTHEVGLPVTERRFLLPSAPS
ncbi:MAG: hypothetical protein ABEK42_01785, partial [Thiohalorhabdaceae bacterium]